MPPLPIRYTSRIVPREQPHRFSRVTDLNLTSPVGAPQPPADLRHPSLFLNRELSWLEFNRRVLHEAQDPRTPLLERLKFLGIFSSNLDEFFQIRVAGLKEQLAAGYSERTPDGLTPEQQLRAISAAVREMLKDLSRCLHDEVLPALGRQGLQLLDIGDLSPDERRAVDRYFQTNVFPVLTPLVVDPAHPFPYISNLSLSLAVILRGQDGEERFARVKVPKVLPRWVPLETPNRFVPLEQLVSANVESLFPGVEILGCSPFRITRNTDFEVDHDEAEDLLSAIQENVRNRRFGAVVRLEVAPDLPHSVREVLLAEFNADHAAADSPLALDDVYEIAGLLDTGDLLALAALDLPALKDPVFHPVTQPRLAGGRNLFEVIRESDLLVAKREGIERAIGIFFEEIEIGGVVFEAIGAEIAEEPEARLLVDEQETAKIGVELLDAGTEAHEIIIRADIAELHLGERFLQPDVGVETVGAASHVWSDDAQFANI